MFAYVKNDQFQYFIAEGTAFEIDGIQYPQNWLNLSTSTEKRAFGIVDVRYGEMPNDKYYWVSQDAPMYSTKFQEVYVGFTATPKDFAQCQASAVTTVKSEAYSILAPTDYIDTRNLRDPSYKPEWMTWRQSILDTCRSYIAQIESCKTVEDLATLPPVVWAKDPDNQSKE